MFEGISAEFAGLKVLPLPAAYPPLAAFVPL